MAENIGIAKSARKKRRCDSCSPPGPLLSAMDICGSHLFEFLPIKSTVIAGMVSKDWQELSRGEVGRRSSEWVQNTSMAWVGRDTSRGFGQPGMEVSADDVPDDTDVMSCLDQYWRDNFDCPSDLLKAIATWNGGWPQFLHSRERGQSLSQYFKWVNGWNLLPLVQIVHLHCCLTSDAKDVTCGVEYFQ